VIGSSATCYWLFVAAEKACHAHFFKQISKGGRFTLECYYFHFFFIALIPDISEFSPELKWCFVCLYFLAVVVSVAAMIGIVYFIPYLHLLLFGKDWGKFHPIPKK
jgi:hypothetical protein